MPVAITIERVVALALQEGAITEREADEALLDLTRRTYVSTGVVDRVRAEL